MSVASTPSEVNAPSTLRNGTQWLLGPDQRVAVDLPCEACGYNLRMLETAANCPECGASVATAVRRAAERPVRWLENIAIGAAYGAGVLAFGSFVATLCLLGSASAALFPPFAEFMYALALGFGVLMVASGEVEIRQPTVGAPGGAPWSRAVSGRRWAACAGGNRQERP